MTLSLSIATGALVAGCPNTGSGTNTGTGSNLGTGIPTGSSATAASGSSTVASNLSFTIVSVVASGIGPSGASSASGVTFTLNFSASNPNNNLNDVCQASGNQNGGSTTGGSGGGNNNPGLNCFCNYTWGQTNTASSQVITRTVQTQPTSVTPFEVQCPAPGIITDQSEIPVGTVLNITLQPDAFTGNNSGFSTNTVQYTVQPVGLNGDFRDTEGDSFINIYHYVCYDVQNKNLTISQATSNYGTNPTTGQPITAITSNQFAAGPIGLSAQAYYYDFYILANQPGNVSGAAGNFVCPTVNSGGNPNYYPMDSEFALALETSNNFPVVIQGRTYLAGAGGASGGGGGAAGGSGGSGGGQGNGGQVIGYAALPNSDGTCPSFTDTTGTVRPTYRLRQFTAIFPLRYNGDGGVFDQSQPNNTIYVLDRPVDLLSQNPLKPITRLGPKPCPFSFSTLQFGQTCSTSAALTGWNIDGTEIQGNPKCPIYPPLPQPNTLAPVNTQAGMAVKPDGSLVIRPYKAFLPHYIENTTLQACAFQSTTPQDPPIVLSYDSTIFPNSNPANFYCAQYYPQPGSIIPPPGSTFNKNPGACSLGDAAAAIKTDQSYACSETYNPSLTGPQTPISGCCQVCSGTNCQGQGGGLTPQGRNAVFSPPLDPNQGANPTQAQKQLPAAVPNMAGGSGCFDPDDDVN